jgi:hypothetical protein
MLKICQIICQKAICTSCCESFGLTRSTKIKRADIEKRVKELEKLTSFKPQAGKNYLAFFFGSAGFVG